MPTETTFRTAAIALDRLATDTDDLARPVDAAFTPVVLRGGRFTDDVRRVIDRSAAAAAHAAAACREAAAECRHRAEVCHAFDAELRTWEAADERYGLELRRWEANQRALAENPQQAPAPGPPRAPGSRPRPAYGWIG